MSMKKYEIVKRILLYEQPYHVDYLMQWRSKDLESLLKKLKKKAEEKKDVQIQE